MNKTIIALAISTLTACGGVEAEQAPRLKGYLAAPQGIAAASRGMTAVALGPDSVAHAIELLQSVPAGVTPVLELSNLMWAGDHFTVPEDFHLLKPYDFVVYLDEPMMRIRNACNSDQWEACEEFVSDFRGLNGTIEALKYLLGKKVIHIEAYSELNLQPNFKTIASADYVGFDCYGSFDACGSAEYGYKSHHEYADIIMRGSDMTRQKLFLVAGTFQHDAWDYEDMLATLQHYTNLYNEHPDIIGGMGGFLWSTVETVEGSFLGAEDLPEMRIIFEGAH